MIFSDFLKALGQIDDRAFRRVLLLGIGLTVALLVAVYAGLLWVIEQFAGGPVALPFIGEVTWLGDLLGWGSLALMILLSVFLMIPVASAITSFFLETVADAVEAKHYPHLPPAPHVPFWDGLRDTVNFFGLMIGANLLAIVAYVFLAPLAVPIFIGLNGWLLGREYFTLSALRREGRAGALALRRKYSGQIWLAGVLMAMPLMIPVMNLFIPILGAATFTHLYHRIAKLEGTTRV